MHQTEYVTLIGTIKNTAHQTAGALYVDMFSSQCLSENSSPINLDDIGATNDVPHPPTPWRVPAAYAD